MKASLFAAVCLSVQQSLASDDMNLLLSVEVSRHGERATGYIFDFTVDPAENFQIARELTDKGA